MEKFEPMALVQQVQVSEDHFNSLEFYMLLSQLSSEEFDKFCKHICHLTEFYATSQGVICSGEVKNAKDATESWKLNEIDFDRPVNYRQSK